jgi:hypothetical protein
VTTVGGQFSGKPETTAINAAGRRADGDDLAVGLVAGDLRGDARCAQPMRPQPRAGGGPDAGRQIVERIGMLDRRLADAVDRAELHRANRRGRAAGGEARDHHHREWPQPHHLFEKLESVHPRHLDVERHDVGIERLDRFARLERIGGLADHLDCGIVGQRGRNQAAHGGRIVDDEHPDRVHAPSPPLSR